MKHPELLVFSDIHNNRAAAKALFSWASARRIDAAAFLGDGAEDVSRTAAEAGFFRPCFTVRGNGDGGNLPLWTTAEFADRRLFLTHGHLMNLDAGLHTLVNTAVSAEADAVFFGHTHIPFWEEIQGLLVLNPGAVSFPRSSYGSSFATVECPPGAWFIIRYWRLRQGSLGKIKIQEFSFPGSV
ncbi:metallophosphoesterase [Treponema sp. OttesenSCG-928-L16]|nr:metallophosphoesterase [Treponema sp. OttesenSCG-928-L16]